MKFEVVRAIKKKGYPTASPKYKTAHEAADKAEKKQYPTGYRKMKNIDARLKADELAGTHTKSGKIKVSEKVPPKERKEVAYHEYVEFKKDPGKCSLCGKGKGAHK